MKKAKSIFNKIVAIVGAWLMFFSISIVKADGLLPENYEPSTGGIDTPVVTNYASMFSNFLYVIAIMITIVAIMYVGLMYITGGITQKVEYKKTLIPMAVGVIIIVFLATILRVIIAAAEGI